MISHIATAAVYVADQEQALRFWTERAGFVVHRTESMGPGGSWIEVGPRDTRSCLVLYPKSMMPEWAAGKPSIVFECADIQKTYEAMTANGVRFTQPPQAQPWGPFAQFEDDEGNWFGLRERRRG